jgi:hypothetical protein
MPLSLGMKLQHSIRQVCILGLDGSTIHNAQFLLWQTVFVVAAAAAASDTRSY